MAILSCHVSIKLPPPKSVTVRKVDWFVLRDGEFIRLDPDEKGRYRSQTFPGLWLDARALVEGDLAKALDVVRQGLATPEHAAFVSDYPTFH